MRILGNKTARGFCKHLKSSNQSKQNGITAERFGTLDLINDIRKTVIYGVGTFNSNADMTLQDLTHDALDLSHKGKLPQQSIDFVDINFHVPVTFYMNI